MITDTGAMKYWKSEDPRLHINKRAPIVIWRQGPDGPEVGSGFVDTKDDWYIHVNFEGYTNPSIDDWDTDWLWTYAPNDLNTDKT